MYRNILFLTVFVLLLGCNRPTSPNVVIIMADDMGYGDLGSYNENSRIPTPHMDLIASQGMRFTNAHSPSAVCTPTRYALLMGRYAWRLPSLTSGVTNGYSPLIADTSRTTVADVMSDAGYHTAAIGKWHLGLGSVTPTNYDEPLLPGPRSLGFDYFFGIPASLDMAPYVWVENERVTAHPTEYAENPVGCCTGAFWRSGAIAADFDHTDVLPEIARRASDYIRSQAATDAPFFLYIPLAAPHTPWLPTEDFIGTSEAGEYGDFVVMVDDAVGQITAALTESNQTENTLLFVTSDNGAYWPPDFIERFQHRANSTWRGMKADIHEGGHRVPLIVQWPGVVEAGSMTDQLTVHTDFFSTLADIAGIETRGEDSFSLLPVFMGNSGTRKEAVHQSIHGMLALRRGPWKLIDGKGSGGFTRLDTLADDPPRQLYNLDDDPGETINRYEDRPEIASALMAALDSLRSQ
ncbi:MAG: arylsulfatase [Bacteroidetes bacterium]|nr:arylsulfatase [Bacteroidota bacterium]